MGAVTRVVATEVIQDTPGSILDYLVLRTDDTIGRRVDHADAIVVGEVEETGGHSVPVRDDDAGRLEEWLSREADAKPKIVVHLTRVRVQEWFVGSTGAGDVIDIVYVPRTRGGGLEALPLFNAGDRGVMFLQTMPSGLAYSGYVPVPSYRLAPGETCMQSFQVQDYDNQGRPYTRDQTEAVEESIAALRWYVALPHDDPRRLNWALFEALSSRNTRIVRHAVRELARWRAAGSGERFREMLAFSGGELSVRLMLGLWVLGERDAAGGVLESFFRAEGKDAWLGRWGVQFSSIDTGQRVAPLFGPSPAEVKGD